MTECNFKEHRRTSNLFKKYHASLIPYVTISN